MDLESLSVRLRPRNGWESVDLGFALVRTWWRPIYAVWLTIAAPLAVLMVSWLGVAGLLLFWWLLPLGESLVLFTLSRAVFGSVPSWKQTLRSLPGLWRQIAPELLLRRFVPARTLFLPLAQLEGLRGQKRRQRATVLNSGQDVTSLLAIAFLGFELVLWIATVAFIVLLTPGWLGVDWQLVVERFFAGTLAWSVHTALWMLAAAAILALHPLYVSAGFALYLSRRTDLEGWDLEIAFRRLARRLNHLSQSAEAPDPIGEKAGRLEGAPTTTTTEPPSVVPSETTALVIALAAVVALSAPGPIRASEDPSPVPAVQVEANQEAEAAATRPPPVAWQGDPERDPRRAIAEIMKRPEFQREKKVVRWRLRQDLFDGLSTDSDPSSSLAFLMTWLVPIARFIASIGEPLLWLTAVILLGLLLRAAWRRLPEDPLPDKGPHRPPPERLFGLDLRPDSLPADVPAEAEALWQAGQHTAALSLLYRGALGRLAADGLELRESFTEDDCLRASVESLESRRFDFFTELTRAWQRVAYAHRLPEESSAQGLWSQWGEHFGNAGQPGASS